MLLSLGRKRCASVIRTLSVTYKPPKTRIMAIMLSRPRRCASSAPPPGPFRPSSGRPPPLPRRTRWDAARRIVEEPHSCFPKNPWIRGPRHYIGCMSRYLDRCGQTFGKLTVLSHAGSGVFYGGGKKEALWRCRCECGVEVTVRRKYLVAGRRWCCDARKHSVLRCGTLTYKSWQKMKQRCGPGGKYEALGIKVCARWAQSYEAFLADMGERPGKEFSIERKDNDGDYEPGNCKWATAQEQSENKRRTVWVEWRGERRKLLEVCRECGVPFGLVHGRLRLGWPFERALNVEAPARPRARMDVPLSKMGLSEHKVSVHAPGRTDRIFSFWPLAAEGGSAPDYCSKNNEMNTDSKSADDGANVVASKSGRIMLRSMKRAALEGRQFGLLTALRLAGVGERGGRKETVWECRCDCGEVVTVWRSYLVDGRKRYCSRERHPHELSDAIRKGRNDDLR